MLPAWGTVREGQPMKVLDKLHIGRRDVLVADQVDIWMV